MGEHVTSRVELRGILALLPAEWRRVRTAPYEVITTVAANGLLATLLWYAANPAITAMAFSFHRGFLFPVALSTWMLSDVPATNQLGADPAAALARLGQPHELAQLLRAKQVVLWMMVLPVAVLAAVVYSSNHASWLSFACTLAWVTTVPFAGLGLSCSIGVRWPYHPLKLSERWRRRRDLRGSLRWLALIIVPYVVVPAVGAIGLVPPALAYLTRHGGEPIAKLPASDDLPLAIGAAVAIPIALLLWRWGTSYAAHLAWRRRDELAAYLADPSRG